MSGYRVTTDVHHNPTGPEGRPHMVVFNGWQCWNLTRDEAKELFAELGMSLAAELTGEHRQLAAEADRIAADDQRRAEELMDNDSWPIDAGHPDLPSFTEAMDA